MFGISKHPKPTKPDPAKEKAAAALPARDPASVTVEVKLSPAQRDKLLRLGGDAWLRERIDKARESKP